VRRLGCAAAGWFNYTSNTTKSTYKLFTERMDFGTGQSLCNSIGGHLVVWDSLGEQNEVGGRSKAAAPHIARLHMTPAMHPWRRAHLTSPAS
jgi:hypothetical protein